MAQHRGTPASHRSPEEITARNRPASPMSPSRTASITLGSIPAIPWTGAFPGSAGAHV